MICRFYGPASGSGAPLPDNYLFSELLQLMSCVSPEKNSESGVVYSFCDYPEMENQPECPWYQAEEAAVVARWHTAEGDDIFLLSCRQATEPWKQYYVSGVVNYPFFQADDDNEAVAWVESRLTKDLAVSATKIEPQPNPSKFLTYLAGGAE